MSEMTCLQAIDELHEVVISECLLAVVCCERETQRSGEEQSICIHLQLIAPDIIYSGRNEAPSSHSLVGRRPRAGQVIRHGEEEEEEMMMAVAESEGSGEAKWGEHNNVAAEMPDDRYAWLVQTKRSLPKLYRSLSLSLSLSLSFARHCFVISTSAWRCHQPRSTTTLNATS